MTISIKPTASGSTIEQDGSTVVSIESDRSVDIDSGTLHIDATNNRVGVNTTNPIAPIHAVQSGTGSIAYFNNTNASWAGDVQVAYSPSGTTASTLGFSARSDGSTWLTSNYGSMLFITGTSGSGSERMRIDSSGKVYIGCTSAPSSSVYGIQFCPVLTSDFSKSSAGSTGGIRHIGFYNPNGLVGGIETSGSATIFATSSDYRLKENVAPMSNNIDRLKQLKPSTWTWVQDGSHGEGFLAHEAQAVVPESVTGTKDAVDDEGNPVYQGIDQSKLVPLLTSALQEAITKIEALEARVATLEGN